MVFQVLQRHFMTRMVDGRDDLWDGCWNRTQRDDAISLKRTVDFCAVCPPRSYLTVWPAMQNEHVTNPPALTQRQANHAPPMPGGLYRSDDQAVVLITLVQSDQANGMTLVMFDPVVLNV